MLYGQHRLKMLCGYKIQVPKPVQHVIVFAVSAPSGHVQAVQGSLAILDKRVMAGISRHFQDSLRRFEKRRCRPGCTCRQPVGGDLSVGDYVLELSDSTLPLCAEFGASKPEAPIALLNLSAIG